MSVIFQIFSLYVPVQNIKHIFNVDHSQDPKSRSRSQLAPFCLKVFAWTLFPSPSLNRAYIINLAVTSQIPALLTTWNLQPTQLLLFPYYVIFSSQLFSLFEIILIIFLLKYLFSASLHSPFARSEEHESRDHILWQMVQLFQHLWGVAQSIKPSVQNNTAGKNSIDDMPEVM